MRGQPPILPRVESALPRAGLLSARSEIGSPAPRFAAQASLIRLDRRRAQLRLRKQTEDSMITLQDHIDELRAELRACLTRRERRAIADELTAAIAAQQKYGGAVMAHHADGGR
jgi:hypothetical protein